MRSFSFIYSIVNTGSLYSFQETFTKRIFLNMENQSLLALLERVTKAEETSKTLYTELRSIRQELSKITCLLGGNNSNDSIVKISKSKQEPRKTILIDSPVENPAFKRFKADDVVDNVEGEFMKEGDYVIAYTDGACENNGKANAKAGLGVWFGDYHPLNISKPVIGRPTNNTAEIQACVECLKLLKEYGVKKVKLHTDSQFTINCITNWIHNWKKKNWMTAGGQPVKNKEDLVKLDAIMKDFAHVDYVHVAGHKGIKGNEEADRLAREGALRYKKEHSF